MKNQRVFGPSRSRAYLNDGNDVGRRIVKLAQVDREMLQLVFLGLFQNNPRPVPHRVDAPEIGGRIRLRVGCSWDGDVRDGRLGEAILPLGLNRRLGRAVALKKSALVFGRLNSNRGFTLLAAKQAHGGDCRSNRAAKSNETEGG